MQFLNSFCIFLVNYSSVCLSLPYLLEELGGSFLRASFPPASVCSSPRLLSSSSLSSSSPPAPPPLSSLQLPVSSAGRQTRRGRHPEVTSCHALDFFPALKKNNHKSARRGFKKTRLSSRLSGTPNRDRGNLPLEAKMLGPARRRLSGGEE